MKFAAVFPVFAAAHLPESSSSSGVAALGDGFAHPKLCDPDVAQTAGRIKVAAHTEYFFWLFESRSDPTTDPLIMWLSGGPACSSQLSLFAENGPCKVESDGSTTLNPYSWNAQANMLWVDQPAGVGFSTGFGTRNEAGVARNMFAFLQELFTKLPKYQECDFYIFGESHAGQYAPAIARHVLEGNAAAKELHVSLKGIAIGNGITHPQEQYKWYAKMGHTGGIAEGGHAPAVFNEATYLLMRVQTPICTTAIHYCNTDAGSAYNKSACVIAFQECNIMSTVQYMTTGKNPYDMRLPCERGGGATCYDFSAVTSYLNREDVRAELGVAGTTWEACSKAAASYFVATGDWMMSSQGLVAELLHQDIQVLIYAGDVDFVGNWLGNKAWTTKLEWNGAEAFQSAEDSDWQMDGETVARLRSARGLHFMQVYNAGMMVPMDQPAVALEMANLFVAGRLGENLRLQSNSSEGQSSIVV